MPPGPSRAADSGPGKGIVPMKRVSPLVLAAALAVIALAPGCGPSTKIMHSWAEPSFQTNSIKKIMVIGVAQNATIRRVFEDEFAAALGRQGVQAISSYGQFDVLKADSSTILAALSQGGCDGVMVTRLLDRKTVETYYPPTSTYVAAPSPYYGGWYGYYSMGYSYMMEPGYTVENEVVNLETNLYRVADAKLIWSAVSESWLEQTIDRGSEIQPFVSSLIDGLARSNIVVKAKK